MKIKMTLGIGVANAHQVDTIDVPDEELEGMDENVIQSYIMDEYVEPWANNYIDYGYEEI
jgi:hypothetical protein